MSTSSESNGSTKGTSRRAALRAGVQGVALGAAGAMALAACNPPGGATPADRPTRREPITLDFNTWYDVVTNPIVPLFAKFEQEHNVKINYDINSTNRDMAKYTAWYVSGTAPDVVNGENFSWSQFYNGGNILEITEYLKRE